MRKIDMSRGRPSEEQLTLSAPMERLGAGHDPIFQGIDVRNFGCLEGLPAARELLGRIAGVSGDNMIAWGNSSLTLMFLYGRFLADEFRAKHPGQTPKWIAITPGYDRHFAITEELGVEHISVPMAADGPNIEKIKEIISRDHSVIGMWCVPKHSNPCGTIYSDECVRQCAALPKSAGEHFTIFWDNAYGIHDFKGNTKELLSIMPEAEKLGTHHRIAVFCSTSKITFAGGGIAGIGLSSEKRAGFLKHLNVMSICGDKTSQLKHVRFFSAPGSLEAHMERHAELLEPKFQAVSSTFSDLLSNIPGVSWSSPRGGYFISLNLPHGTATRVCDRAAEKGITMTKAGSAYPYGKDPADAHLRIAPSQPSLDDITYAARVIAETVVEVVGGEGGQHEAAIGSSALY
jgi:DNA-binding transcriptional MocR family regulator